MKKIIFCFLLLFLAACSVDKKTHLVLDLKGDYVETPMKECSVSDVYDFCNKYRSMDKTVIIMQIDNAKAKQAIALKQNNITNNTQ